MKNSILFLAILFHSSSCLAQNNQFVYSGRKNAAYQVEKINTAITIYDICPKLWEHIGLTAKVKTDLDLLKKNKFTLSYFTYDKYDYSMLVNIESTEIITENGFDEKKAFSNSENLSPEQKKLISAQPMGSEISINIKFHIKNPELMASENEVKNGVLRISLVPTTEAKFIGGYEKMCQYLNRNTYDKVTSKIEYAQLNSLKVKFMVDSTGIPSVEELKIKCKNEKLNKLVLEALKNMPLWIPAKDINGKGINQNFEFYFGNNDFDGC